MLALVTALAASSTNTPPDDGTSIGLIILGVAIALLAAAAVFAAIFLAFRTYSKRTRETGPDREPHKPGHVGRVE